MGARASDSVSAFFELTKVFPEAALLLSGEGEILAANPPAASLLGLSARKLRSKSCYDLTTDPPEHVDRRLKAWSRTRTLIPGSLIWKAADGQVIDCRCDGAVVQPPTEDSVAVIFLRCVPKAESNRRFLALNKDLETLRNEYRRVSQINERLEERVEERTAQLVRSSEQLQESEALNRAIVDTAADAIITISEDGIVSSFNSSAERIFGYDSKEIVSQPLRVLIPEPLRMPHEVDFRRYLINGEAHFVGTAPIELVGLRKDGEEFPLELSLGEMRTGENQMFTGIIRDITERKLMETRLKHQALHDSLTELPNRKAFMNRLEQALRSIRHREGSKVAVLFVDLDGFKGVNDSLGHEAGDDILVSVGRRLQALLRSGDTVARFGGDEFIVLLEDIDAEEASRVAQRLIEEMRTYFALDRRGLTITCSVGIALGGAAGEQPADLLRRADMALYDAKAKGKNRYGVFEEALEASALERLEMEHLLRQDRRLRGAGALEPPVARAADAQRVHRTRRADRRDSRDRALGA